MTPEQESILDFVRGRRDVESLAPLGITVSAECDSLVVDNPNGFVVSASPADVAEGFLTLASRSDELRVPVAAWVDRSSPSECQILRNCRVF